MFILFCQDHHSFQHAITKLYNGFIVMALGKWHNTKIKIAKINGGIKKF